MKMDAVLVMGKELRLDRERGLRELRARAAAASVFARRCEASLMALEASKDEIIRLEDKQTVLIDSLIKKDTNQCVIDGGPGSGKTVIV